MKKWTGSKNAIRVLAGIFMTFVSFSACGTADKYELSDDTNAEIKSDLDNGEQAEKGTESIMHNVDSVPEEANFTDKWFGISDGKLVCVDLKTKETAVVWDFSEAGYYDIQFVHNGNDIYAIGKSDSIQDETASIWKINMEHFDREKLTAEPQYGYAALMLCTEQMLYAWYGNPGQTKYVSYKIDEEGRLEKFHEEDGTQGRKWMMHPFYMDDVYGYRLYVQQKDEERKIVALDTESGNREYLTEASVSLHSDDYETIPGNAYIAVVEYSNSLLDTVEVISLKEGSIKPLSIQINGKPYQMMDEWFYYVAENDVQKQLWRVNVETGEVHQLTAEECREQRIPDWAVFETFENDYGTYLCRCDNWQEVPYKSSKQLSARIYNTHVDEIGTIVSRKFIQTCDTCGGDVFCVGITTICFKDRTEAEQKLVEAAMKFQQGYVDDLTDEFMRWIQPDETLMSGHMKDENGLCSRYSSGESYCEAGILYMDKNYLCLKMDTYGNWQQAAHPFGETDCVTYLRQTGEELRLADLVDYTEEEWKEIVKTAFIEDGTYVDMDETILERIEEETDLDMKFALTGEGICIYFDRYEVADYAMGEPEVVIPYDKLALKIELHPEQFNSSDPIPD